MPLGFKTRLNSASANGTSCARKGASGNELRADLLRLTFVTAKEAAILTLRQRSARSHVSGSLAS